MTEIEGGYFDPPLYIPSDQEKEEIYIKRMCLLELREETYRLELEFIEYLYGLKYTDGDIADICGINKNRVESWRQKYSLKANRKSKFIQNEKFTKKDKAEAFNKKMKLLNRYDIDEVMREIDQEDLKYPIKTP